MKIKFYDTCSLLESCDNLDGVTISSLSIVELENIKTSAQKDDDIKYKARKAVRTLKDTEIGVEIVGKSHYDILEKFNLEPTNDNLIIACAYILKGLCPKDEVVFYTEDFLAQYIAKHIFRLTVDSIGDSGDKDIYKGYKEVVVSEQELAYFYENMDKNIYDSLNDEYLILNFNDEKMPFKWTGEKYISIEKKTFKSMQFGLIKPLDEYQMCAFDSIMNNDITVLIGRSGSGKTTIPLAYLFQQKENGKINGFNIVNSYDALKGQKTLGFVKGEQDQKLKHSSSIGGILSTKLGSETYLDDLMRRGVITIIPTANIRGVEFTEICYVTEAQNLDLLTVKTLVQRMAKGSKLIFEGDILEQCDRFNGRGLIRLMEVFKKHKSFGVVKLKKCHRSEFCSLADEL